jgi:hypothetical protein
VGKEYGDKEHTERTNLRAAMLISRVFEVTDVPRTINRQANIKNVFVVDSRDWRHELVTGVDEAALGKPTSRSLPKDNPRKASSATKFVALCTKHQGQ